MPHRKRSLSLIELKSIISQAERDELEITIEALEDYTIPEMRELRSREHSQFTKRINIIITNLAKRQEGP